MKLEVGFRMENRVPSHYNSNELPKQLTDFLALLAKKEFTFLKSAQAGKTINVYRNSRRFGYINGSVLQKNAVLGYHFAPHGAPTNRCPPELLPKLVPVFCQRYGCAPDDLILHEGSGSNSGHTYLVIKSPAVALRTLLLDAGLLNRTVQGMTLEDEAEVRQRLSDAVARSLSGSAEARRKRLQGAPKLARKVRVTVEVFERNADVIAEVLESATGKCSGCDRPAPFNRRKDGQPYLEVHHRVPLSLGGEDTVANAIALCPNCHREAHYGEDAQEKVASVGADGVS